MARKQSKSRKQSAPAFTRVETAAGCKRKNTRDESGTVKVQVIRVNSKGRSAEPGNIAMSLRIADARVSTVMERIEQCLFG